MNAPPKFQVGSTQRPPQQEMRNPMAPPDYGPYSDDQYMAPPPSQYNQNRRMDSPPRQQPPMQPPPMQRQKYRGPPPPSQRPPQYDMYSDQSDDDDEDMYDQYQYSQDNYPSKPAGKGGMLGIKCAGRRYSMVPIVIYLIVVGLSFFGLLFSKQSMAGNLGLIAIDLVVSVLVGGIIYYLTKRCQTLAAMVVLVIALILQLFLIAGAGIWFII